MYNLRGLIVHTFGDGDFGLIQTRFGKVLFERNICHDRNAASGEWQRCKTPNLALKPGRLVKLHARVGKFKVKKTRAQYLYATKVWTCTQVRNQSHVMVYEIDKIIICFVFVRVITSDIVATFTAPTGFMLE